MTSAEARNADATVEEFRDELIPVLKRAEQAGLPLDAIALHLLGQGAYAAFSAGMDSFALGQLFRVACALARLHHEGRSPQPDSNPSSPASAPSKEEG